MNGQRQGSGPGIARGFGVCGLHLERNVVVLVGVRVDRQELFSEKPVTGVVERPRVAATATTRGQLLLVGSVHRGRRQRRCSNAYRSRGGIDR